MSTTQVTGHLTLIVSRIIEDLEFSADTAGKIGNGDIVSSFQNVVMMDFGTKIDELPLGLQDLYYRSKINPTDRRNFEILRRSLDHMARNG